MCPKGETEVEKCTGFMEKEGRNGEGGRKGVKEKEH